MYHRNDSFLGQGGVKIRTQYWGPEREPVAVVLLVHGLAEHSDRYGELVERLVKRRYAVYALDHRGHGDSGGARCQVDRFDWLVADLGTLYARMRADQPAARAFLLGHSMGGAVAFAWALRNQDKLRGLVLSAPALGVDPKLPWLQQQAAKLMSKVAPNAGVLQLPADQISRDPVVVRRYEEDPRVHRGKVPARTAVELFGAMERFPALAPELALPVLVVHGTGDRLVPLDFCRPVYERLGSRDRTVKLYPGLYHEVFNEPERAQVYADVEAWLDAHL